MGKWPNIDGRATVRTANALHSSLIFGYEVGFISRNLMTESYPFPSHEERVHKDIPSFCITYHLD